MSRHRIIEPATPQPLTTRRAVTVAGKGSKTVKNASRDVDGGHPSSVTLDTITPQPVKTKPSGTRGTNSRQSTGDLQTPSDRGNTPAELVDAPTDSLEAKNSRQSTGERQTPSDRGNTPAELVDALAVTPHEAVAGAPSNGSQGTLAALRASVQQSRATQPQPVIQVPEEDWLDYAQERYVNDPLLWVQEVYPWGEKNTPLEVYDGPDTWQREKLERIRQNYCLSTETYQDATASGHGIGKTTMTVWITQWFLATRPQSQVVITASTSQQISTVIWRELSFWHFISPLPQYFEYLKTMYRRKAHPNTWLAIAKPSQITQVESFQGLHNENLLVIMDEASAIDPLIWDTVQSNFTRQHGLWLVFGNPLSNSSRFRQCYPGGRFAHRWKTQHVDSRQAKMADKEYIQKILEDYGEESDEFKRRVTGHFPETDEGQYIDGYIIQGAIKREPIYDPDAEYIIGIDLARSKTGDASVLLIRHGSKIVYKRIYRERDGTVLRDRFLADIELFKEKKPRIYVDSVSGWGLMKDMLEEKLKTPVSGISVNEVQSGGRADDAFHYAIKRVEMWARMKKWLETKGCLDVKEENLIQELTQVRYTYPNDVLALESKPEMKARGLSSGDEADALAFTFAEDRKQLKAGRGIRDDTVFDRPSPFSGSTNGWMA